MARYDGPLFSVEDLIEERPYIELWGHRVELRDPARFSLADNNKVVALNRKLARLEKLGELSPQKEAELEEVASDYLAHVTYSGVPEEVAEDARWCFNVKLRIITAYNQIFTQAMNFAPEAEEASPEEMIAR